MQLMQPRMVLPDATTMKCQQTRKPLIIRQNTDLHAENNTALAGDDKMHDTSWHADMAPCVVCLVTVSTWLLNGQNVKSIRYSINGPCSHTTVYV